MAELEKSVFELIGDFYRAHLNADEQAKNAALLQIEARMESEREASEKELADFFNGLFSGKTDFGTYPEVSACPKKIAMRELFRNITACRYMTGDIKIAVDFRENDVCAISYNEAGFSVDDLLCFLGSGIRGGNGAGGFGSGARSVFSSVSSFSVRSADFAFGITNKEGSLSLENISFGKPLFKGTRITLELEHEEYESLLDNFLTLTEKKGDHLNLPELCFAFIKRRLTANVDYFEDGAVQSLNVAVARNGKPEQLYRITLHRKDENDTPKVRFYCNNKSLLDFLYYESEGFMYLIPLAIANSAREQIVNLLFAEYNYFSVYELTGYGIGENSEPFIDEKLSAFFVSVPDCFITSCRSGIRCDSEEDVANALERDIPGILKEYSLFFALDIKEVPETEYYRMTPRSYAFEFFSGFLKSGKYSESAKNLFMSNISFLFPSESEPVSFEEIKETGFGSMSSGVEEKRRGDGSADKEYIELRLEKMKAELSEFENKTLYAGYEWINADGSEKGRVYLYEFFRGDKRYKVFSEASPESSDYELYTVFSSIIGYYLPKLLSNGSAIDEAALEKIFALFDSAAENDYSLSVKEGNICFDNREESYSFDISKIEIKNIGNAMEILNGHRQRFWGQQYYAEAVEMIMRSFTRGKDVSDVIREIKAQGGNIELVMDSDKKYCFQAYGKKFGIPDNITNQMLLEIMDEPKKLLESGVLYGRKFDFENRKALYALDKDAAAELLKDYSPKEKTAKILDGIYLCDLKYNGMAFLDKDSKVLCIQPFGETADGGVSDEAVRFIILRDDFSKAEYTSVAEYIVTGKDRGILCRRFTQTREPNRIIPDQIFAKYKRAPILSREEMEFVFDVYNDVRNEKENALLSRFAKDINGRLYGYGAYCAGCKENGYNINSMGLSDFTVDVMTAEGEKRFNFTLYLCKNHIADSGGWFIQELSIGSVDPFTWLKEIKSAENISPKLFDCSIKYMPFAVYGANGQNHTANTGEEERTLEFRLTPLMAAKWIDDNSK